MHLYVYMFIISTVYNVHQVYHIYTCVYIHLSIYMYMYTYILRMGLKIFHVLRNSRVKSSSINRLIFLFSY